MWSYMDQTAGIWSKSNQEGVERVLKEDGQVSFFLNSYLFLRIIIFNKKVCLHDGEHCGGLRGGEAVRAYPGLYFCNEFFRVIILLKK